MVVLDPTSQSRFCFVKMSIIGLAIGLGRANSLTIDKAILTGADVAIAFFGLFL